MIFTHQPHLIWRHCITRIAPTVAHIGEHIRHLFIGKLHDGGMTLSAVNVEVAPPPGPVTACKSMLCGILLPG